MTAGILCLLLPFISGCGKKEEGSQLGIDGYVYMPEALPQSNAYISRVKAYDGCLYYAELYNTGLRVIKGISTEGEQVSNITVYMPYGDLEDYCVDEEGAVYYFLQDSGWSPNYAALTLKGGCLVKMLPDGKVDYLVELPEANAVQDSVSSLAIGQDGQVFLLGEDAIWLIDAQGKPGGKIPIGEYKPESTWLQEQVTEGADV